VFKALRDNLFANTIANALGLIYSFVSIPVFLGAWGQNQYGEWLVIYSVTAYLGFSELGLGPVVGNELSKLVAQGERTAARILLQRIWTLQCLVIVALVACTIVAVNFISVSAWLSFRHFSPRTVSWLVVLMAAYVLVSMNLPICGAIFRAEGYNAAGVNGASLVRLADASTALLLLFVGAGPIGVASGLLVVRVASLGVFVGVAWIRFPLLRVGFASFRVSALTTEIGLGVRFSYLTVANALMINGAPIVLNYVLGPRAVVSFTAVRAICRLPTNVYGLINSSTWPEISRLMAVRNLERVRKLNRVVLAFGVYTSVAWCLVLLTIGARFFPWWTGGTVRPGPLDLVWMGLPLVTGVVWNSQSISLTATDNHVTYARLFLFGSVIGLFVSWLAVHWFGYASAAAANLCVDAILLPYIISKSCRLTRDRPATLFRESLTPTILSGAVLRAVRGAA
jgi:O-antigen/teichoic acid export membrane protein